MNEFDEACLEYFLAHQEQLLPEPVAETIEEARSWRRKAKYLPSRMADI